MRAILWTLLMAALAQAQPYQPTVIWDRTGETDSSAYGYKILPLGDQNDDGFADWAVLAYGNIATWHGTQRPYLEFFHGGTSLPTEPYFVFQQDSPEYYQSWSADVIGDINGDGYQDWITAYWPEGFPPYRIYGLFFGGHGPTSTPDFEWQLSVTTGFYRIADFNFNGDGYDDLFWVNNETQEVRICYGGNPLDTLADWTLHQPPPGLNQTFPSAVGDFNGDGASDFMCFNPNNGNLAVFLGGTDPDTIPAYFWSNQFGPDAGIDSLNGDVYDEWTSGACIHFGRPALTPGCDVILNSIAGAYSADGKDFNGDGYHDLILYTWSTLSNPFGALDLHLGDSQLNPDPVFVIEGDTPPLYLRGIYTAVGLGDVNGDGLGDIAIGAWHSWFAWRGRCVILGGDRVGVDSERPELAREFTVEVFPNPFNSEATIRLMLPWSQRLNEITIYNVFGQAVRQESLPPFVTELSYRFDARDLASGIYFVHVRCGTQFQTKKAILLR